MLYNILDIQEKEVFDLLTDNTFKSFIKSHYDLDHICYKKYDNINTIIIE